MEVVSTALETKNVSWHYPPKWAWSGCKHIIYIYIYIYIHWLVVYLPLWKIWKSIGMIIPNLWKVIKAMFQSPPSRYIWTHQVVMLWHSPPCCPGEPNHQEEQQAQGQERTESHHGEEGAAWKVGTGALPMDWEDGRAWEGWKTEKWKSKNSSDQQLNTLWNIRQMYSVIWDNHLK